MSDWIQAELDEYRALAQRIVSEAPFREALGRAAQRVIEALAAGHKVMTLGNGGSAADAQHLSEELCGRYRDDRPALAALCLVSDAPALTCIANDYGFEHIFSRQIEALGKPGDVVVAFSTSGESENIIQALQAARRIGVVAIGLLGKSGGRALALCDEALVVPHQNTARIQEIHGLALHVICEAAERRFKR